MGATFDNSFVDRISRQGEEALGRIAEELAGSSAVTGAVSRVFEARERAVQVQEAALGALNIPSAADVERVTRRLRSVSQRLESIEDTLDRLEDRLAKQVAAAEAPAVRPAKTSRSTSTAARKRSTASAAKRSGATKSTSAKSTAAKATAESAAAKPKRAAAGKRTAAKASSSSAKAK